MSLVREFTNQSVVFLKKKNYESKWIQSYNQVVKEIPLNPERSLTDGLKIFMSEIILGSLAGLADEITEEQMLEILHPYFELFIETRSTAVFKRVIEEFLMPILKWDVVDANPVSAFLSFDKVAKIFEKFENINFREGRQRAVAWKKEFAWCHLEKQEATPYEQYFDELYPGKRKRVEKVVVQAKPQKVDEKTTPSTKKDPVESKVDKKGKKIEKPVIEISKKVTKPDRTKSPITPSLLPTPVKSRERKVDAPVLPDEVPVVEKKKSSPVVAVEKKTGKTDKKVEKPALIVPVKASKPDKNKSPITPSLLPTPVKSRSKKVEAPVLPDDVKPVEVKKTETPVVETKPTKVETQVKEKIQLRQSPRKAAAKKVAPEVTRESTPPLEEESVAPKGIRKTPIRTRKGEPQPDQSESTRKSVRIDLTRNKTKLF